LQQAYADSNAETTYPHSDTLHANSVSNSVAIFVANPYGDCYANNHGDPYRYCNAHGDPYGYDNAYCYGNTNCNAHGYPYGYRYTNCNGNAYGYRYSNGDGYTYGNSDSNCNSYRDTYAVSHSYANCYPYADRLHLHAGLLEDSRQRELSLWQQWRRMATEYPDSWERILHEG
jgi:hypothetical protein